MPITRYTCIAGILLLAGCGDSGTEPDPSANVQYDVAVQGLAERGLDLAVALVVRDGSHRPPADSVTWHASPESAAEVRTGGVIRLREAGALTLTGTIGGRSFTRAVTVATPPRVVFEANVDGNTDLYAAALDGRDVVRLTTDPLADVQPTTATGRIVYVSYATGAGDLYSIAPTGGTPQRLTTSASTESEPALSPGGERVAYSTEVAGVFKLMLAPIGGAPARLAPSLPATTIESGATWSPAGDRLAFMSTHPGSADLFLIAANGTQLELLAGSLAAEVEPAWSPDGSVVAFATVIGGDTEIVLANVSTRTTTRLTNRAGSDGQPAWLPDGRLVYTAYVNGAPTLRWIDPATPVAVHEVPLPFAAANAAAVR